MSRINFSRTQITAAAQKHAERDNARTYLRDTDWYLARLTETGVPVPLGVSKARAAARKLPSQDIPPASG